MRLMTLMVLWFSTQLAWAHHSYSDYDRDERYELLGTIKEIHWANPHIMFIVNDGTQDVRVEWFTVSGAERSDIAASQFAVGDAIIVIGSRHRDPDILVMTVLKEMSLPQKDWKWVTPLARYYRTDDNMDNNDAVP
jgi:hypothetical protein